MNARIAASSFHRLQVQKVLCASRSTWTSRLPAAVLACRDERSVCQIKPGRKRHDRNRRRVIDTNGMLNQILKLSRVPGWNSSSTFTSRDDNPCE